MIDPLFPSYGSPIRKMLVAADGKLIVASDSFPAKVVRLLSGGDVDIMFAEVTIDDGSVTSVALQADGSVLISGGISSVNGDDAGWRALVKANSDGSVDGTYSTAFGDYVSNVATTSDGGSLATGSFDDFIWKLNGDGSQNMSFEYDSSDSFISVNDLLVLPDNSAVLLQASSNPTPATKRINSDGSIDGTYTPFVPDNYLHYDVLSIMAHPSGGYVLCGGDNYQGFIRKYADDGTPDTTFNANSESAIAGLGYGEWCKALAFQSDGKVFVSVGVLYPNTLQTDVVRLNANGTIDESFVFGYTVSTGNGLILFGDVQGADEALVIGGTFANLTDKATNEELDYAGVARILLGDGPSPEPAMCFWTDLVQATQVCGTTPPPSGGLAFVNTEGHGGGFGSMRVVFEHPVAADVCAPGVVDLLSTASSVVITGYIYDAAETAEDIACNYPAPSGSFSPVNFEMAYDYTPPFGEWRYYMESEEQEPLQGYHYVRLLVNGVTEIIGVMHRGSGV